MKIKLLIGYNIRAGKPRPYERFWVRGLPIYFLIFIRDDMFISGRATTHIVPTGLKRVCPTFNYKHSVPTGLKRVSGIENSLTLHL